MSKESLEWLNRNTLIGFTDKRSKAWHYRASEQGSEPNHYPGAIPVADVKRRLFSWQALQLPISIEIPTHVGTMTTISDEGLPIRFQRVPGRKAIATSDDFSLLGVSKTATSLTSTRTGCSTTGPRARETHQMTSWRAGSVGRPHL